MSRVDVLYVSWNRREMTVATCAALLANTDWSLVHRLYVHDDDSSDGSRTACAEFIHAAPVDALLSTRRFGGPVATMNWYLDQPDRPEMFAKVDNDFIVCPGWLNVLLGVMDANPDLGILGTEPGINADVPRAGQPFTWEDQNYQYRPAAHIGGKGLIRASIFDDGHPMHADGYQGFTQWQQRYPGIPKGWIHPDLPCFGLDQLPAEPWRSLTTRYVERGWQRRWPEYSEDATRYWDWWLK